MQAKIQSDIGTELPIIFEERAELALMPPVPVVWNDRAAVVRQVLCVLHAEGLHDGAHRTGKVEQQVLSGILAIGGQARKNRAVDSGDGKIAGAKREAG